MEVNERVIVIASVAAFAVFIALAVLFSSSFALATNLFFLSIVALTAPYSFYRFIVFRRLRAYEKEFPAFLRDIAESQRAGLSILQSVQLAANSDYGLLSKEIQKMATQLSWNVPLETVLESFGNRMKLSRIISKAVMIIVEANKSGGNVEDSMDSLATNIELLRDVQEEKGALMNQQVVMMYALFFIFLGITIALIKFLIPLLQTQSENSLNIFPQSNSNPCMACIGNQDFACVGCSAFFTVSEAAGFGPKDSPGTYYKSLFFVMVVVQGLFSGLIAGQIGSDSVAAGVKHSAVMLISGIFVFILVVRTGII